MAYNGYSATATATRPNDTTAYVAGDVVGGVLTLAGFGPRQSTIMVLASALLITDTAVISGEAAYRLHLYSSSPPSGLADNAAWDLSTADAPYYQGYVDLGTVADIGSSVFVQTDDIRKVVRAGDGVYGYLVTVAGYTPSANRVYKVTLHTVV